MASPGSGSLYCAKLTPPMLPGGSNRYMPLTWGRGKSPPVVPGIGNERGHGCASTMSARMKKVILLMSGYNIGVSQDIGERIQRPEHQSKEGC